MFLIIFFTVPIIAKSWHGNAENDEKYGIMGKLKEEEHDGASAPQTQTTQQKADLGGAARAGRHPGGGTAASAHRGSDRSAGMDHRVGQRAWRI